MEGKVVSKVAYMSSKRMSVFSDMKSLYFRLVHVNMIFVGETKSSQE